MEKPKNGGMVDITDEIYREILRLREHGKTAALATVIDATGSTPGKVLFKMLVYHNGETLGTIGGGAYEGKVISEALAVINTQRSRVYHFEFQGCESGITDDGPICGGKMEVLIEPITVKPTLFIIGAGHIGQALVKIGKTVGFKIVVIDDREEFANRERLPDADEILLLSFDKMKDRIQVNESSYIVIVTRGHQHDEKALKTFARSNATYIGMVGSGRKVTEVFQKLLKEGIERKLLDRVYAPVGLAIGAQTPSEIAISIVAELIAHKYGKRKTAISRRSSFRHLSSSFKRRKC